LEGLFVKSLVTGIAGFAGSHLAEHLLACGHELLGIVRGSSSAQQLPMSLHGIPLLTWDLADPRGPSAETVSAIRCFAPTCIFHLAAQSLPGDCGQGEPTAECLAVNVQGTERVVDLACGLPRPPRVLFVSTSRVYAPVDDSSPRVDENYPVGPVRGYGHSKLLAEQILADAARHRQLDVVIVRAFQHTGTRQDRRLMLPEWARQLAAGHCETLTVRHLDAYIDCSDVRDVVRAYALLADAGARGATYNVGSGIARRSGDVLEQLCQLAGSRPRFDEQSPGRVQDPIANIDRLVAATGWRAETSWEQTLRDTLDDWRQRSTPIDVPKTTLESTL
jgi:GDP-4-dehydro-6-deoxy-D-mannose reductase